MSKNYTFIYSIFIVVLLLFNNSCQQSSTKIENDTPAPIPIKLVVISMFELGEDTGDRPGEFQYWVERLPLNETIPFPQGYKDLRYNSEKGILGICTGMGIARATASIMALGLDPRFDLTNTYFMVAGIAGIDPEDASTGSAVWAQWLIDGDLSHEIDSREIPSDWETGYLPLRKKEPYELPLKNPNEGEVYKLNEGLVNWAFALTKNTELMDTEEIKQMRAQYVNYSNAQQVPKVLIGDQLAASTYWHGKILNEWANKWVKYWTGGEGNFVTSAMEDTGTMQALKFLEKAGKVDSERVLVLRTASNFTMQYEGISAAQSLSGEKLDGSIGYSAFIPALEAAWRTGSIIVEEITGNWEKYKNELPSN
ncbi:MAG: purine nucleoside permease [Leptolyngbya sp. SIO3F4]|nr:purine nucleoside permease [Leptolyngbya sp. SIO3F4]